MELKDARILVTGATGCIGSELITMLSMFECKEIIALSRNDPDKPCDNVNYIKGDICDKAFMKSLISGIDILVHLAAKVHVLPKNVEEIKEFYKINNEASKDIFKMAFKAEVKKVVFLSTVAVYGTIVERELTEEDKCEPITPYAQSKYMAEKDLLKLNHEKGLPMTILRPVTVFGAKDQGNFKTILDVIKSGVVPLVSNGSIKKSYIYSKDVAKAICDVISNDSSNGKIYLVKGFEITIEEFVQKVAEIFNIKPYTIALPYFIIELCGYLGRRTEVFNSLKQLLSILGSNKTYSDDKITEEIGFKPKYNFEAGLKDSLNYYKS